MCEAIERLTEIGLEAATECAAAIERKYPGKASKWDMPGNLQREWTIAKRALNLGQALFTSQAR
ncbi:MAG: hypothetical protein LBG89_02690 [Rickettsiales bacterium]|jgi:hypothetical protein|nr:hypothetical protein [Rickettsiales bacterium]